MSPDALINLAILLAHSCLLEPHPLLDNPNWGVHVVIIYIFQREDQLAHTFIESVEVAAYVHLIWVFLERLR